MAENRRWGQQYALYLPRTLLAWQSDPDPPPVFEEDGTFLLVDISGFTAMSEMLAEKGKVGSEAACEHVHASLELARTAASDYEIAQTLEAAQRIDGADPARDQSEEELMHKLGVVARPWLPLRSEGS